MTFRSLALAVATALCSALPLHAGGEIAEADILTGWRSPDGSHMAALRIRLSDGWKTYWRAPGDAGIPPRMDWSRSGNLGAAKTIWPTPMVFNQSGMRSIGYREEVVIPLHLTPKRDDKTIRLDGVLEIGVCKEICVPKRLKVRAKLPADATKRDPVIAAAMAARPYSAKQARVRSTTCRITPQSNGLSLSVEINMPSAGGQETVVVETGLPDIWVAEARATRKGGTLHAETEMMQVDGKSFMIDRSALRFTVLGKTHAVDIHGCSAN